MTLSSRDCRYEDTNARVYKIMPLNLPEGWRKDLNYSARTSSGINLDALPTAEGAMVGVIGPYENVPARPASDWSIMRIYLHILHPIGPS